MNLDDYLTRVKSVLATGTYDTLVYSDDLITEGVRQALREYDQSAPAVSRVLTVTAAGRDQQITGLLNFLELLLAAWPYVSEQDWRPYVVGWHVMSAGWIELETAGVPQVGDKILYYYRKRHTIDGLNDEVDTTVAAEHEDLLVLGAAGWSAELHVRQVAEAVKGPQPEQLERMQTWGDARLAEYRRGLADMSRSHPVVRPCWGNIGL